MKALRALVALLAGVLFGLGLAIAQMTDPLKVQAFLDLAGDWDPSLAFVMGGAVTVAALGFALVRRRPAPWLEERFHISARSAIDRDLCLGALLFGIGWGAAGYCPGPAISSLGFGNAEALWFVPALLAGAALQRLMQR
jgi:uncharacterized membrane protein YedE/YeeE